MSTPRAEYGLACQPLLCTRCGQRQEKSPQQKPWSSTRVLLQPMITPLADRAQNPASQAFDVVYEAWPEELGDDGRGLARIGWISYFRNRRSAVSGQYGGVCGEAARSMVGCC